MSEAKKRASINLAMTDEKVRKSLNNIGTFGRVSTGRIGAAGGTSNTLRRSSTGVGGPKLRTASRSSRQSRVSSNLISDVNSNGIVSASTVALFDKTIDYAAE